MIETKIKADTKLTIVMCCQIVFSGSPQRNLAAIPAIGGLWTAPHKPAKIISFKKFQPAYVFFKKTKNKKNLS